MNRPLSGVPLPPSSLHPINVMNTMTSQSNPSNMGTGVGTTGMHQGMGLNAMGTGMVPNTNTSNAANQLQQLYQYALNLIVAEKREGALLELSKKREAFPDLAPILWHSVGTIAALLQEIISIYPLLQNPASLTPSASNRCCNALALLQCVASHADTRTLFLNAHIPLFLYPFLNTTHAHRPFEYLRLTSLGVIGALVKVDDSAVISFLLQTEIIPLCLRIMESGSELSKTVATFIVQKILLDSNGLKYICATYERFITVSTVLANMISTLEKAPSGRLLKHIIRCYLRLSDNEQARETLRATSAAPGALPMSLQDATFAACLKDDQGTKRWLNQLLTQLAV